MSVFDTQVAAGFAGFSAQAGYNGLLHDVLRIRLPKTASFTRWDARPLTDEQLRYARGDVEHLLPLADDIVVLPGHGEQTSIGRERATNPFLLELVRGSAGDLQPAPRRGL